MATLYMAFSLQGALPSSDKTLEWSGTCWRRSSGACLRSRPDSVHAQHLPAAGWGPAVSVAAALPQDSSPQGASLLL